MEYSHVVTIALVVLGVGVFSYILYKALKKEK
jgi:hypothetical protein